jgi:acetone carboxylase gamma subunit
MHDGGRTPDNRPHTTCKRCGHQHVDCINTPVKVEEFPHSKTYWYELQEFLCPNCTAYSKVVVHSGFNPYYWDIAHGIEVLTYDTQYVCGDLRKALNET